jgi:very-short-patch-repair endonuclease
MEGYINNKDWGKIIKLSKESNGAEKIVHFLVDVFYQQNNKTQPKKKVITVKPEKANVKLKDIAESLRRERLNKATESEILFANILGRAGIKHKREHVLYPKKSFYIVDFYLPDSRLVIEIDGGYHSMEDQEIRDTIRTSNLINECGVSDVLRFENEELVNEKRIVEIIKMAISNAKDKKYRNLLK